MLFRSYPDGIPTSVSIDHATFGRLESGLVRHPLGHAMADPARTARLVELKFDRLVAGAVVDPDALRVLYRLHEHRFAAYLVGGGVRDLLLGRRPKDFDIGTDAHPSEIKKLFRNCWIIGRRFRLAHVRFGMKAIEVATFRRNVPAGADADAEAVEAPPIDPVEQGRLEIGRAHV